MLISETDIQVRYAETDQMGVVYHANYLVWLELGRTQLIQELGFQYADMEKDGIISPVIDVKLRYKKPARYGDSVKVQTWIESYNGLKVIYGYHVLNEKHDILLTGETIHICVKKDNFKPIILRKYYADWDEAYNREKKQPND